jgi:hypothetical protein
LFGPALGAVTGAVEPQNTIVVRPFKVVRSRRCTRLKPRTTVLRFDLSFCFLSSDFLFVWACSEA